MSDDLTIISLRGGMNDSDPAVLLPDDQVTNATNVEFFYSALGERRQGTQSVTLTNASLTDEAVIVHLSQWFPANDVTNPEWWAIGATVGATTSVAKRTSLLVWSTVAPNDAIDLTAPDIYLITSQSLNGKLFWACHNAVDRLHVWDGTNWRRTGLAQPAAAPTGANEGGGAYATVRYFRVRYATMSGTTVLRRSEPSATLTFTPSGAGAGTTVTRPALISEGETHWELEASTDNANFYRIARTIVATTTVNDEVAFATGYAASGTLSDAIGAYTLQLSAKFLCVDGDRLLLGGHWTDAAQKSTVSWSAVFNDPGVGNDERAPIVSTGGTAISTSVSLDNYDGGALTGLGSAGVAGTWYAFKWDHIYKMVRTGDVTRAYDVVTLSNKRGAIEGSVFSGVDENGAGCVYFADPMLGPSRIGPAGIQTIKGLRTTWGRVNLKASKVVARGMYYPYKQQARWWIAVDGGDSPSLILNLQVSEVRQVDGGIARGWSLATGRMAEAYAVAALSERETVNSAFALSTRPFIGQTTPEFMQRCDVGSEDNANRYVATITTRPYLVAGLLNKWGAMVSTILATAAATGSMVVRLVRDFGKESNQVVTDLAADGSETLVIKDFDNLSMSEARVIQVEFSDQ